MDILLGSKKKQANFFLSTDVIYTLKKAVPPREQSAFVEAAVIKELQKRQFLYALSASAGAWHKSSHREKTSSFVRSLRQAKRI